MNERFRLIFFFASLSISRSYKNGMARYLCDKEMSYGMKQSMLDICYEKANYYGYSITGFNKGLQECRKSFRNDRWNCTTEGSNKNYKLFGQVMARGTYIFILKLNKIASLLKSIYMQS